MTRLVRLILENLTPELSILIRGSTISTLVPLASFLIKGVKLNLNLKILFFYLLLSFTNDFICISWKYQNWNNYLINAFAYIEFICFSLILTIRNLNLSYKLFLPIIVIFTLGFVSIFICSQNYSQVNDLANGLEAFLLIVLSIRKLFELSYELKIQNIFLDSQFWLFSGILLYFSSVLFLFLFSRYILDPSASATAQSLWPIIHSIAHILFNFMFSISVIIWKRTQI